MPKRIWAETSSAKKKENKKKSKQKKLKTNKKLLSPPHPKNTYKLVKRRNMKRSNRCTIDRNLSSQKKSLRLIRSYKVPLTLKTQKRTHKPFSPIERRNMRPLNEYNIGRILSSRKMKKKQKKAEKNCFHENLEL